MLAKTFPIKIIVFIFEYLVFLREHCKWNVEYKVIITLFCGVPTMIFSIFVHLQKYEIKMEKNYENIHFKGISSFYYKICVYLSDCWTIWYKTE